MDINDMSIIRYIILRIFHFPRFEKPSVVFQFLQQFSLFNNKLITYRYDL